MRLATGISDTLAAHLSLSCIGLNYSQEAQHPANSAFPLCTGAQGQAGS